MPPPSKRRRTDRRPEEIQFDSAARADYLTGFHKRKLARIKHAQEAAEKKERADKIKERKELRQRRKEELEEHIKAVDGAIKGNEGNGVDIEEESGDDSDGEVDPYHSRDPQSLLDAPTPTMQPVEYEDEYIDEDKYTTVTVEAVGISKEGFSKADRDDEHEDDESGSEKENPGNTSRQVPKNERSKLRKDQPEGRPKKKRKKFRYESKGERKLALAKQRQKKSKLARARKANE